MVQAAGAVADRYRILLAQCSMQSMTNYGSTINVIDHKRLKPIFLLTAVVEMTPPLPCPWHDYLKVFLNGC